MAWQPFTIKSDTLTPGLKSFAKKVGITGGRNADRESASFRALRAVGLQLLNFAINGSENEKVVPPIREGILRGSGSAFVDGVLVGDTKGRGGPGSERGDPNKSYDGGPNESTVGFNTAYAARMHETTWTPGGVVPSPQAERNPAMLKDVGNKFVEKHLVADRETLLGLYADVVKKESGA
jgi:hypothetical protein